MEKTKVVNIKYEECDVYIGRPSKWGNPFEIGKDGTRKQVIEKHKKWLPTQPHLMASLHELKGKKLGCFCHPLPCHGDNYVELLEEDEKRVESDEDFKWRAENVS